MIFQLSITLIIACTSLQCISCEFSNLKPENILWFTSPKENGSLIPAFLEPSSTRIESNESFIHFYLYTKQNPTARQEIILGDVDSLEQTNIVRGASLKILIHGFGATPNDGFPQRMKNEYLKLEENLNIIVIDWEALAENPNYFEAVANTKTVGRKGAQLLEWLISQQVVTRDKIHILGFSLGAHVAGIIGSNSIQIVPRITAIDPSEALFDVAGLADRIDASDAEFVDVIHAAGSTQGSLDPQGHCDFYPNGGTTQPGCGLDINGACSHQRAPAYFEESIIVNPFGFRAVLCDSWLNFESNLCSNNRIAYMGAITSSSARGKFYLRTNSESPYAQTFQPCHKKTKTKKLKIKFDHKGGRKQVKSLSPS